MSSSSSSPDSSPPRLPTLIIVLGALFFLGLMALMLYGVSRSKDPDRDTLPSVLIGKPAPDFLLPLLHEPQVQLSGQQLRGEPYLLNVWGSWCPTCRDEHPVLTDFAASGRIRLIGYNWKDERNDALRWLQQLGDPYTLIVVDEDGRTALDWGIAAAPETFLIDANGSVRWKYSGAISRSVLNEQLIPALERLEALTTEVSP